MVFESETPFYHSTNNLLGKWTSEHNLNDSVTRLSGWVKG